MRSLFRFGRWDRYLVILSLLAVSGAMSGISSTSMLVFSNSLMVAAAFVGQRSFANLLRLTPFLVASAATLVWAGWNIRYSSAISVDVRETVTNSSFLVPAGLACLVIAQSWLLHAWITRRSKNKETSYSTSSRTSWMIGLAVLLFAIAIVGQMIRGRAGNYVGEQFGALAAAMVLTLGFTMIAFLLRHIGSWLVAISAVSVLYVAMLLLSFASGPYVGSFTGLIPLAITLACSLGCTCIIGMLFRYEATEQKTTSQPSNHRRASIWGIAPLVIAAVFGCFAWFHDLASLLKDPSIQNARVVRKVISIEGMQAEIKSLQPLTTIGLQRGLRINATIFDAENCPLFEVLNEVSDSHNYLQLDLTGLSPEMDSSAIHDLSKRVFIRDSRISADQIADLMDKEHGFFMHSCEVVASAKTNRWNATGGIYFFGVAPGNVANALDIMIRPGVLIEAQSLDVTDWKAIGKASMQGGNVRVELSAAPSLKEIDIICATESDPDRIEVSISPDSETKFETLTSESMKKLVFTSNVSLKLPWDESKLLKSSFSDQDFWDAFLVSNLIDVKDAVQSRLRSPNPRQLREFHLCFDGLGGDAPVEKLMMPDGSSDSISIASLQLGLKNLILGETRNRRRVYSTTRGELDGLANLTELESLFFGRLTPVQDCSFLATMPKLKQLTMPGVHFNGTAPANFPASKLVALESVTITSMIQPGFAKAVAALPNLKRINVHVVPYIEYSAQDVAKLKACFPAGVEFEFSRDSPPPPADFQRYEARRKSQILEKLGYE